MVGDKRNVQRVARACEGAISVFGVKRGFEEEQTAFATSFCNTAELTKVVSYTQGWDLFFLSFFILSLFYKL